MIVRQESKGKDHGSSRGDVEDGQRSSFFGPSEEKEEV
jgi:hypothetical protein